MQKPIVTSLIISIISLFVIDVFLGNMSRDLWKIVAGLIVVICVGYYSKDYIGYAISQSDIFLKDYLIGVGVLCMMALLYAYDHQTVLSFLHCHHHCHIVYESDMTGIFLKYVIGMLLIYTFVFVLQLPEKEGVKK